MWFLLLSHWLVVLIIALPQRCHTFASGRIGVHLCNRMQMHTVACEKSNMLDRCDFCCMQLKSHTVAHVYRGLNHVSNILKYFVLFTEIFIRQWDNASGNFSSVNKTKAQIVNFWGIPLTLKWLRKKRGKKLKGIKISRNMRGLISRTFRMTTICANRWTTMMSYVCYEQNFESL